MLFTLTSNISESWDSTKTANILFDSPDWSWWYSLTIGDGYSNDEEGNYDADGKQIAEAQRGTLKPGTMNTINAEFESFDYTETSSALR